MAGIDKSPRGALAGHPLLYRDSQNASRNFRLDGDFANSIVPKPKFLFFVKFNRGTGAPVQRFGDRSIFRLSDPKDGIVIQVKQIDRPKFNIKTETLNQYNKKRVIQTQIEYQNMTIAFHDDVSNKVMLFWAEYYAYYYGDGRMFNTTAWVNDITSGVFHEGPGSNPSGWGYLGDFGGSINNPSENTHFLESIDVFQFFGGSFTKMTFVHPKITMFDHDQNDYEDGREGSGIRMSFDYEGVIYDLIPTTVDDTFTTQFGEVRPVGPGQISSAEEQFNFSDTYYDINAIINAKLPPGGQVGQKPRTDDIAQPAQQLTNKTLIANAVLQEARSRQRAGESALSSTGITFGGAGSLSSSVIDFVTAISLSGNSPSLDALQKATGIKTTIDNFGIASIQTPSIILANLSSTINSGFDASRLAQAGSILGEIVTSGEQSVGPGQTVIASSSSLSSFKRSFGAATVLAQQEGIIQDIAAFPDSINHLSADAPVMFNKLPDGSFQATELGLFTLQALRAPSSALGTNRPRNPFINPDAVNNNVRAIAAETNEPSLDVNTFNV